MGSATDGRDGGGSEVITFLHGDAVEQLRTLPDCSVQCCVTSPPYYGLRDYSIAGQIGMEETPELFVSKIVEVFREVKRVLRDDGTLWLNFGDSYNGSGKAGSNPEYQERHTEFGKPSIHESRFGKPTHIQNLKPKDMIGIPWMVAFALRADGWYLRSDIIWSKPNPMPESVTDRPTKAHEYVFLMTKSARYYYDADAIRETYKESSLNRFESNFRSDTPSAQATKNPSVKIDGEVNDLFHGERSPLMVIASTVRTIGTIINAMVGHQDFKQADTPAIFCKTMANPASNGIPKTFDNITPVASARCT